MASAYRAAGAGLRRTSATVIPDGDRSNSAIARLRGRVRDGTTPVSLRAVSAASHSPPAEGQVRGRGPEDDPEEPHRRAAEHVGQGGRPAPVPDQLVRLPLERRERRVPAAEPGPEEEVEFAPVRSG